MFFLLDTLDFQKVFLGIVASYFSELIVYKQQNAVFLTFTILNFISNTAIMVIGDIQILFK